MEFDNNYTNYWKERIRNLSDGTRVPDTIIADNYAKLLDIQENEIVLDIGCSFGRFFPILSLNRNEVWGIDIEENAIKQCGNIGYKKLAVGKMESMPFDDHSIDKVFCWATFDCTEQKEALIELARVLRIGGKALISGKNIDYLENDEPAFIAERNARQKGFPNHFTDVDGLIQRCHLIGLSVNKIFRFRKRGDLGLDRAVLNYEVCPFFYEFIILVEKISELKTGKDKDEWEVCSSFSKVAKRRARNAGYDSVDDFFNFHLINEKK